MALRESAQKDIIKILTFNRGVASEKGVREGVAIAL
jgi:hypothetical protein